MSDMIKDQETSSEQGNLGRRRFVRGVGIAVPLSLTVAARSTLAATCTTVSAHASIALANSHNATGDFNRNCTALSPVGWSQLQNWGGVTGKDMPFSTVFTGSDSITQTMKAIFVGQGQGQGQVVSATAQQKIFAAAYLNLVNEKVANSYDIVQLQGMWNGRFSGYLAVLGGPLWYAIDSESYLQDTWT